MMRLEDIKSGALIQGLEPEEVVRIVTSEAIGIDALTVYYKKSDGSLLERLIYRSDELNLSLAMAGRPWSFDAPAADFKLAVEACRINLAYLFDPMMAVHTSNVEPLPHQITAVYESMLPRQPLRYVLADDPGAGKTIMAGLYIRELIMRADATRILIIAPGSLVEQWQDEMYEKFGLDFFIFSREMEAQSHSGNPFEDFDYLIARIDMVSRDDELIEKLKLTYWDLVVIDEAHKCSASWFGHELKKTKRYKLAEEVGSITRHFLLMTATPHKGKDEDFQTFLALLDSDRFYGKPRDSAHSIDISDLMRRMVKEELLKFDGTRLFPERKAYSVSYKLSDLEADLYLTVTEYVREEMNKADRLEGKRRNTIGFALTILQRRLASSPEAIYQSLKRRTDKLGRRLEEEKLILRGELIREKKDQDFDLPDDFDDDDWDTEERETQEEELVDRATTAQTIQELGKEIIILNRLTKQAKELRDSGLDRKWEELSNLFENNPHMREQSGRYRKLIIFTEHRDTLSYLHGRLNDLIGNPDAVIIIHGGIKREERRKAQELFRNDPRVSILLATDAAGEGVNLQNANLMVNYDLPWNPNRIEQRFGRIHRIGQQEVCHLWNMVAMETREGDVFLNLFNKLEVQRQALGGRVFDILGDVFEEKSLRDLLIEAIRYGDDPVIRAKLFEVVEGALDTEHIRNILSRNALCEEVIDEKRLFAVKEEMEKAEARKLQPYFIRAFFSKAFEQLRGELRARESGRWEITYVPAKIRERDRQISGRNRRNMNPVTTKYERICFDKQFVRLAQRESAMASFIHPGHPLMMAVIDLILEIHRNKLKQGSVMLAPNDEDILPKAMLIIDHSIKEGQNRNRCVSRRMQFVEISPAGEINNAGWAPHLDLEPISEADFKLVEGILSEAWLSEQLEARALAFATAQLAPEHFNEVNSRREQHISKTLEAVHQRLIKEIDFWSD
ncbi:MAG: DEAD/DEAH box helicase, partial [Candidatus Cloacimonetes bacterium]|nr:DEAD/DEAH box helicase [Candidatus Cloacimonadota bacterium]